MMDCNKPNSDSSLKYTAPLMIVTVMNKHWEHTDIGSMFKTRGQCDDQRNVQTWNTGMTYTASNHCSPTVSQCNCMKIVANMQKMIMYVTG